MSEDGGIRHGVAGGPRALLRLEEAALLALCVAAYHALHFSWALFALLFFTLDLAMLGYLAGPAVGAACYNATHFLLVYLALGAAGASLGAPELLAVGLIGAAHISFDRMLGYGLKYASAFTDTHLGPIGRARA